MGFSNQEAKVLVGLANLVMTTEGLEVPAGYMKDIVGEQEDLIGATRKSKPGDTGRLIAIQQNLGQAVFEVSELVAGTGASLDFEQAMTFAGSDMGLSVLKLKSGEIPAAVQAQTFAAESVAELRDHFDASVKQFQYFVTALEFLNERHTDGVVLHSKLGVLRKKLEDPERGDLKAHATTLAALQQEALTFSNLLLGATGRDDYAGAQPALDNAVRVLTGQRPLHAVVG